MTRGTEGSNPGARAGGGRISRRALIRWPRMRISPPLLGLVSIG